MHMLHDCMAMNTGNQNYMYTIIKLCTNEKILGNDLFLNFKSNLQQRYTPYQS